MRLIDADQMAVDESEAYMSAQVQGTDDLKWLVNFAVHSKIQRIIADTPTVDAVPVVRCRDCRKFKTYGCRMVASGYDDFCSYGERKEGTEC